MTEPPPHPERLVFLGTPQASVPPLRGLVDAGWPIDQPTIGDLWLGINQVYAAHRQHRIVYFDDLVDLINDKSKYRREKDRQDNVINKIYNKPAFHRMDAERYVISEFIGGPGADWDDLEDLGTVEDFESKWT